MKKILAALICFTLVFSYFPTVVLAQAPETTEKCDILIIAVHPDDDVLYFGPVVPVYAVNRGYSVQVVFMTSANQRRRLEAIAGQKILGNPRPPVFGPFSDTYARNRPW